jgi:hypothetical protein
MTYRLFVGFECGGIPDFEKSPHSQKNDITLNFRAVAQDRINQDSTLVVDLRGVAQTQPETASFTIGVVVGKPCNALIPKGLGHQQETAIVTLDQGKSALRLRKQCIPVSGGDRHATLHIETERGDTRKLT